MKNLFFGLVLFVVCTLSAMAQPLVTKTIQLQATDGSLVTIQAPTGSGGAVITLPSATGTLMSSGAISLGNVSATTADLSVTLSGQSLGLSAGTYMYVNRVASATISLIEAGSPYQIIKIVNLGAGSVVVTPNEPTNGSNKTIRHGFSKVTGGTVSSTLDNINADVTLTQSTQVPADPAFGGTVSGTSVDVILASASGVASDATVAVDGTASIDLDQGGVQNVDISGLSVTPQSASNVASDASPSVNVTDGSVSLTPFAAVDYAVYGTYSVQLNSSNVTSNFTPTTTLPGSQLSVPQYGAVELMYDPVVEEWIVISVIN